MNITETPFDRALEAALKNPKYNLLTGRIPNLREEITNFLWDFFTRFIRPILSRLRFPDFFPAFSSPGLLRNIFIGVAIVALAAIIVFFVKNYDRRKKYDKSMEEIFDGLSNNQITYGQLLADAENFANGGWYREAIRYEYIALLWVFNQSSVIFLRDAKTNNQLKREVKSNAEEFYASFCHLVDMFNYTWFGHKPVTSEAYQMGRDETLYLIEEARRYEKKS